MKVVVLGDSFGLPRGFKNSQEIEVKSEEIYPEQLRQLLKSEFKQEDIMMINMCKRFNNSWFLIERELSEVYLMQPEYLVIQIGLVDCWSREKGVYICEAFKGKDPWIDEIEYRIYMKQFIESCLQLIKGLKAVIVVNISKTEDEQYKKHLGSYERTISYNKILQEFSQLDKVYVADVYGAFEKELNRAVCSDGVHPSSYGNFLIANEIYKIIGSQKYFESGIMCLECNETESAVKYFKKVYEWGINSRDIYFEILDNLIKLSEFDLFNNIVNEVSKEYDFTDYEKHGELMIKYGLDELAMESFIKAIELKTNNSKTYSYIANKFMDINDVDNALNFAFTALNFDEKNIAAYDIIVKVYTGMGDFDKAKEFEILKNKYE